MTAQKMLSNNLLLGFGCSLSHKQWVAYKETFNLFLQKDSLAGCVSLGDQNTMGISYRRALGRLSIKTGALL